MGDNRHEVIIGQEAGRLRDALDKRFERKSQRTRATITSLERDAAERITRAIGTIDGAPGQLVQCSVGAVLGIGDIVEVQNQGTRTVPRWQFMRRLQTVAAVPPLDGDIILPVPTGLDLETGVHIPEPGGGIKVWIYGSWHTIPDHFGSSDYDVQMWTNDQFEDPIQVSVHDSMATAQLVADITDSDVVIPRGYAAQEFDFARFGRAFIEGELFDYDGVTDGPGDSGTGTGGSNTFTDSGKSWDTDEWVNYALVDSAGDIFLITANTSTVLTIVGTPASGSYYIYPCFRGCTRGVGSTAAAAHTTGVQIIRRSCGASADSLVPDTDYNVRVRAHRADGAISNWSTVVSIQTDLDTTAPAVPTGMAYEGLDIYTIRLSWTPNTEPDLDYYLVDCGPTGGTGWDGYPANTGNAPTLTVKCLYALPFTWRVCAVDTSGNASDYCLAQDAEALFPTAPDLQNPGFEEGTGSPDHWTLYSDTNVTTTWTAEAAYPGTNYGIKVVIGAADDNDEYFALLRSDYVAVEPGAIYDLGGHAKTAAATSNVWKFSIEQYQDAVGTPAATPIIRYDMDQPTPDWSYGFKQHWMIDPGDSDVTHIRFVVEINLDVTYAQTLYLDSFWMSLWFMYELHGDLAIYHSDLLGITSDQHHDQAHSIDGGDHTASGTSQYDVLGVDPADTITFIPASADPGASAKVLRSTGSGYLSLVRLNTDTLADKSGGNLTIQPGGDLIFNPGGDDLLPETAYDLNIGSLSKKYLTLHCAELWVDTLVAQETIATIGGRILVGPTTTLVEDLQAPPILANNSFEDAGGGGLDVFSDWTESAGTGTITRDSTYKQDGSYSCKISNNGTETSAFVRQVVATSDKHMYKLSFYARGDGTCQGDYAIYDNSNGAWILSRTGTGVTGTTWTQVTVTFATATDCIEIVVYFYGESSADNSGNVWFDYASIEQWSIKVKHNQIIASDINYMEGMGKVEFMRPDGLAIAAVSKTLDTFRVDGMDLRNMFPSGTKFTVDGSTGNDGEYTVDYPAYSGGNTIIYVDEEIPDETADGRIIYTGEQGVGPFVYPNIARNLDGTGANLWYAGDALFNTGQAGDGFIDIYSVQGIDSGGYGPAIVGNIRQSGVYNNWLEGWAVGCLNGIYGYSGATDYGVCLGLYKTGETWVSVDATNGFRINLGTTPTTIGKWDTSGNIRVGNTTERHILLNAAGSLQMKDGSDILIELDSSGYATFGNVAASQANMYWNGTQLQFRGGASGTTVEAFIDTDGTLVAGGSSKRVKLNTSGVTLKAETGISTGVITWEDSDPKDVAQLGAIGPTNLYIWSYATTFFYTGATPTARGQIGATGVCQFQQLEIGSTAQGSSSGQIFADDDIRTSAGLSIGDKTKNMADGWGYFANGIFINETDLSGDMTKGIIIHQGTASDEVLAFRGTNVGHDGYLTDPETFGRFSQAIPDAGGLAITGHKDAYGVNAYALTLQGYLYEDADTSKTAGKGIVDIYAAQTSGGALANVVANGNVLSVRCRRGGADVSLLWVDEDGDLYIDGAMRGSDPIAVRAYHNTTQPIGTGSFGPVYLNSEYAAPVDVDAMHSTSTNTERVTCVTPGFYVIMATVQFAANATGVRQIRLRWYDSSATSTATVGYMGDYGADATTPTRMQCMAGIWMDVGDYVYIEVYQNSGGDLNVQYVAAYTPTLSVVKVA